MLQFNCSVFVCPCFHMSRSSRFLFIFFVYVCECESPYIMPLCFVISCVKLCCESHIFYDMAACHVTAVK